MTVNNKYTFTHKKSAHTHMGFLNGGVTVPQDTHVVRDRSGLKN